MKIASATASAAPDTTPVFDLFAQCPPGIESLLTEELAGIGCRGDALRGGVRWRGGWPELTRANLHLRTASRVLIEIGSFGARALGELERKAASLPWERVHAAGRPLRAVRFRVGASRSRLYHEGAIEERLRTAAGFPQVGEVVSPGEGGGEDTDDETTLVVVRVHRDVVTVRLDTSGEHLHRRGNRTHVGVAPMRETLAAALLLTARGSLATPAMEPFPLLDPFCGSGTIAIEAALLARRIAPGLARAEREPRAFAFTEWHDFPRAIWAKVVEEAREAILPPAQEPIIFASDRDASVIEAARANAMRAGVGEDLSLSVATLSRAPLPPGGGPESVADPARRSTPGWIITNPPYGGRLGARRKLRPLYASLGGALRSEGRFAGWRLLYLSGDPILDEATGLPLEEHFRTTSGGLPVRAVGTPPSDPEEAVGDPPATSAP